MIPFTANDDGVTFAVRGQPNAKKNAVVGVHGGAVKVAVSAPPEDGRANEAILQTLSDWLGVKRNQVELIRGASNRSKVVRVSGVAEQVIASKLEALTAGV